MRPPSPYIFFFNDPATTEIYTLSLHDALPIPAPPPKSFLHRCCGRHCCQGRPRRDRKSTRLNSSHRCISYAVFCLKKKKPTQPLDGDGAGLFMHLSQSVVTSSPDVYTMRITTP